MIELIVKSIKIVETEIYNNRIIAIFANMCISLLVLFLQFGDITLKVTGNYIMVVWVAVNVCLTFDIFLKENREHILCIGKFKNGKRFVFLIILVLVTNSPWLFAIFIQLLVSFNAYFVNAIIITAVQYLYAIALGTLGGTIRRKGLGVFIIGVFGLYNFIFCSPYNYEASSHMFIISELVFTVNDINIESIINFMLFAIFFLFLAFSGIKMSLKRIKITILLSSLSFVMIYIIFLEISFCLYQKSNAENAMLYDKYIRIEYKGLSEIQIENIANILTLLEDGYNNVKGDLSEDYTYVIQKKYLPEMAWLIQGEKVSTVQVTDDIVKINILSPNMLYFENADLLKSLLEEISVEMEKNIPEYNSSKFTRHTINGYSISILEQISEYLNIASAKEVYDYYYKFNKKMLDLPSTEYNYIKKIAYVVYSKYPEQVNKLYRSVCEKEISSDEEFIDLIMTDFGEIYKDNEVANILSYVR